MDLAPLRMTIQSGSTFSLLARAAQCHQNVILILGQVYWPKLKMTKT